MRHDEIEKVLGAAMQVDDRMDMDKYRIAAWAEIVDKDMPYEFAINALREHYAQETTVLMPAHLNRAWRSVRLQQREKNRTRELTGVQKENLSPESLAQMQELRRRFNSIAAKANPNETQGQKDGGRPASSINDSTASAKPL